MDENISDNAVLGSLVENLDNIEIIFKETVPPFTKDRQNTGDSKELTVRDFLKAYLPGDFRVQKGVIFNKTTCSSKY